MIHVLIRTGAHRFPGIPWRYRAVILAALAALAAGTLHAAPAHMKYPASGPRCAQYGDCRGREIGQFHCGNHCRQLPRASHP